MFYKMIHGRCQLMMDTTVQADRFIKQEIPFAGPLLWRRQVKLGVGIKFMAPAQHTN